MNADVAGIHDFWFGPLDHSGMCDEERNALWFTSSPATDNSIRQRFGSLVQRALGGELDHWSGSDDGLVALIVPLDQFTRNLYRDTPQAFDGDEAALALARDTIANGRYQRLPAIHQAFLFMPLEHCEQLAVQEQCVTLFEALAASSGHPLLASFARYAAAHRDVIARFGRFPHRNAILGRENTPEEQEYLEGDAPTFGQSTG